MSSHTLSRAVVQGPAKVALGMSVCGTAPWVFFTAVALGHMGSLLTVGSLLLFMFIGVVTGALVATSICLWRAAQRLPATRLSPEAVAQEERKTGRRFVVGGVGIAALLLADFSLISNHGELVYPVVGLIFGIGMLLVALLRCPARYVPASLYYLGGGAFTLLSVIAVLALLLGVKLGGAYKWTMIVGLGYVVIFWLTALYLLSGGGRLLHQGTAMRSSSGQS
jgi:hypothetical protein